MDNEYNRLYDLLADRLPGAKLVDWQPIERLPDETAFIVLWRRPSSPIPRAGRREETDEWGTHRAVLANDRDEGMLVWGHYFFNRGDAIMDFNQRMNGTENVS